MIITCSALQTYALCQVKWYNRHILGWHGPSSEAQEEGTAIHQVLAGERPILPGDPVWLSEGAGEFATEWPGWGAEIIAREVELTMPMGAHTLVGKPDAIARWNNMLWHVQYKSLRSSLNPGTYTKAVARSWHEGVYAHLIQRAYPGEPYGGTILVMMRKLGPRPARDTSGGARFCFIHPLSITDADVTLAQVERYANEMEVRAGTWPRHENRDACMGTWGNQPCWFLPVCNGESDFKEAGLAKTDPMARYVTFKKR